MADDKSPERDVAMLEHHHQRDSKAGSMGTPEATATDSAGIAIPKHDFSGINEKKLIRKLDVHLVPFLALLYLLSFLDRTAIGNASLYGLKPDLNLSDQQYLLTLTIFFIPYALFEPPSNVLLRYMRPRLYLSIIMLLWGACMICQGFVQNYGQLLAVRFLLGLTEAGLFPGVNYLLSAWYKRAEFGIRAATFFSAATASGAFGGLLAAAIGGNVGTPGDGLNAPWRWIFYVEGLITVVVAFASFRFTPNFPDDADFLNETERAFVIHRLQEDQQFSAAGEGFAWRNVFAALKDPKTILGMFVYAGADMPLYAFSLFLPTIVNSLGYTANAANLISVPVYVWACILTLGVGFIADRYGGRARLNLIFLTVGATGYIILAASRNAALSYFATYLAASGIYPLIPNSIALTSQNFEGSYKRGVAVGSIIAFGNINGAVSSNVYRAMDKPWYTFGHGIVLMYVVIGFIATSLYWLLIKRENAARDRGERDEIIDPNGTGPNTFKSVEEARRVKGDNWSGFRYAY